MRRQVEVGRREPYEMPMPAWGVGRDIIVGARESRVHQDVDGWRRSLACGKTGTKVLGERGVLYMGELPWS